MATDKPLPVSGPPRRRRTGALGCAWAFSKGFPKMGPEEGGVWECGCSCGPVACGARLSVQQPSEPWTLVPQGSVPGPHCPSPWLTLSLSLTTDWRMPPAPKLGLDPRTPRRLKNGGWQSSEQKCGRLSGAPAPGSEKAAQRPGASLQVGGGEAGGEDTFPGAEGLGTGARAARVRSAGRQPL